MKHIFGKTKLSQISHITMGQSPSSESYNQSNGLPFFQGNADFGNIYPRIRFYCTQPTKFAKTDDILISVRAPIGAVNISNSDCCIGRGLASVRAIESLSIYKYLYYLLLSANERLNKQGTGSTFKAISKVVLHEFGCYNYPINTQHQIVSELDTLSDIITKKKQQLAALDALAQATFYDMFGDPVNNEKGWEVDRISNISKIRIGPFGSLLHVEDYIVDGTPLVNPSHMSNGKIVPDYNLSVSSVKIKELSSYLLKEGDLIVGRRGDIGRCALVTKKEDGYICGTGSMYVRFNSKINPAYALKTFSSKSMVLKLQEKAKGATMLNINAGSVGSLPFPIPPLSLQNLFISKIEAIEKQKQLITQSIADVQQLFDYTMDKYFN